MILIVFGFICGSLMGKAYNSGDAVWAVAAGLVMIASAIVDATERRKKNGRE